MNEEEKKIRVAVLYGGKSVEHEVSIRSAKNIIKALNTNKYDVVHVKIDSDEAWNKDLLDGVDVVFPILLGSYGEDGCMQGFLKISNIPFVGSDVLASAIGMDKDITKRLLREAGIPVAKFMVFHKDDDINFTDAKNTLGLPLFVKPASLGSSIGVSKVKNNEEFMAAINEAFIYDTKILLEEFIPCREIEFSVLGNKDPIVSVPGEIVLTHEFYDYEAKYLDNGTQLKIPAELSSAQIKEFQQLSIKVFKVLGLQGMARIDFFLALDGKLYVNEANTLPGFTDTSMYPKLWEASGISYSELVDRLIQLALEKHAEQNQLKTWYKPSVQI